MGTRVHSEKRPPETASGENSTTSETPSSVGGSTGETPKAVAERMPITSDIPSSLVGSSESGESGYMSPTEGPATQRARGSVESNRPGNGSASIERATSGFEERDPSSLPQEDYRYVVELYIELELYAVL